MEKELLEFLEDLSIETEEAQTEEIEVASLVVAW